MIDRSIVHIFRPSQMGGRGKMSVPLQSTPYAHKSPILFSTPNGDSHSHFNKSTPNFSLFRDGWKIYAQLCILVFIALRIFLPFIYYLFYTIPKVWELYILMKMKNIFDDTNVRNTDVGKHPLSSPSYCSFGMCVYAKLFKAFRNWLCGWRVRRGHLSRRVAYASADVESIDARYSYIE